VLVMDAARMIEANFGGCSDQGRGDRLGGATDLHWQVPLLFTGIPRLEALDQHRWPLQKLRE
jgi:hypothetical protein